MQSRNDSESEPTIGEAGTKRENTPETGRSERDEGRDLGLDQVFEILKNQRRRYVLQYLRERQKPVSLSELSEQIAAWENDKEVRSITSSERKRVYVGLYQCHLPKMDGMDVVDFNKPRAIIEPGANIELFYQYLDAPGEEDGAEFSKYYLGLSVASLFALIGSALAETALAVPAVGVTATVSLLGFLTLGLLHHRRTTDGGDGDGIDPIEQ